MGEKKSVKKPFSEYMFSDAKSCFGLAGFLSIDEENNKGNCSEVIPQVFLDSWRLKGYKNPNKGTYFQLGINISQRTLECKWCESLFQRLMEERIWRNQQPVVCILFPESFSVKTSNCNIVRVTRFRVISSGNLKCPHFRGFCATWPHRALLCS